MLRGRALRQQLFAEELQDALHAGFVALFGQDRVIGALAIRKFDGQERITEQLAQRFKARADKRVAGVAQPQHLAASRSATCDDVGVGGGQVDVGGALLATEGKRQR